MLTNRGNDKVRGLYHKRDSQARTGRELDRERIVAVSSFISCMKDEYERARKLHPEFESGHKAYGVMLEEFEEIWEEIKHPTEYMNLFEECVQMAALCMATALELR